MAEIPPREIILKKAGELFHRKGFGAVSLEAVIESSALPKAAFYKHFSSKEQLGCIWLERLSKRMTIMNRTFLEQPCAPERRLRKYFFAMLSWVESNGFRSCQFANTAAFPGNEDAEMTRIIDHFKRAQRTFFIDLVKTLVDGKDAQRIGTIVFLLYSGAMTEAQNLKATWPLEDALAAAEQVCGVTH